MINDFIYFSLYILLNIREKYSSGLPGFTPGSLVESVLLILFSYAVLCFLLCLFVCLFVFALFLFCLFSPCVLYAHY